MKKKIFSLLLALGLVILALAACSVPPTTNCTNHTDKDGNGKCDICAQDYCAGHEDNNFDRKCDYCGATVPCFEHADANGDRKCDY